MDLKTHRIAPKNHPISWSFSRLNCNGKEKDYESGFHYYGARYYWSELLTSWLSVDPMMDKYPNISSYNYCVWNPVKLVDPDGREMWKPEILKDGTINYIKEAGDNVETLRRQYALSSEDAKTLYGKMSGGKISGKDVKNLLGSKILKFNLSETYKNRRIWNEKATYHLGFALLYNHQYQKGKPFQLKKFFEGMPTEVGAHSVIPRWNSFGRSFDPHNNVKLCIPAIGGGDIPVTFADCTASSKTILDYAGIAYKENGTYQLRWNAHSEKASYSPLQKIMINIKPEYYQIAAESYGL